MVEGLVKLGRRQLALRRGFLRIRVLRIVVGFRLDFDGLRGFAGRGVYVPVVRGAPVTLDPNGTMPLRLEVQR